MEANKLQPNNQRKVLTGKICNGTMQSFSNTMYQLDILGHSFSLTSLSDVKQFFQNKLLFQVEFINLKKSVLVSHAFFFIVTIL